MDTKGRFLQHAHGDSVGFTTLVSYLPSPEGTSTCLPSGPGGGLNRGQTSAVGRSTGASFHKQSTFIQSERLTTAESYCTVIRQSVIAL